MENKGSLNKKNSKNNKNESKENKNELSKSEIHKDHRARFRKRYTDNDGFNCFDSHHILEFLLFHSIPRKDTNALAHKLLNHFDKSFTNVLEASVKELMEVNGIGEITATYINSISHVVRKYNCEKVKQLDNIEPMELIKKYLLAYYTNYTVEVVVMLCLNNKMKIIHECELYKGSVSFSDLDLNKVAVKALEKKAAYVVIAHNHPDGFPIPSIDDLKTTSEAYYTLRKIKIKLKEHFLIGNGECVEILQKSLNM